MSFDSALLARSLDCTKVVVVLFGGGSPNVGVGRDCNFLAFPVATVESLLSIGVGKFGGVISRSILFAAEAMIDSFQVKQWVR